jgi:hypothetical protein
VRGAIIKEAREYKGVLLGLVTCRGKRVKRGATLRYTGRDRKGKNKLDSSRGFVLTET